MNFDDALAKAARDAGGKATASEEIEVEDFRLFHRAYNVLSCKEINWNSLRRRMKRHGWELDRRRSCGDRRRWAKT